MIVGLTSYGQASYESGYNGGMGSNGLTAARHDVFSKVLKSKYPESFDALGTELLRGLNLAEIRLNVRRNELVWNFCSYNRIDWV